MGLFDDRRLSSHVRIWNGGIPVGSGFVVGDRQIMTCAHVVGDAAGCRAALLDREDAPSDLVITLDLPFTTGPKLTARVAPGRWRPERSQSIAEGLDDAAVLVLEEGQALPSAAKRVGKVSKEPPYDDWIRGYGVGLQQPGGVVIRARYHGLLTHNRFTIHADEIDEAIRPGCSGAAAWSSSVPGVAGMVVEMQQNKVGRLIPVDVLEEIWPLPAEEHLEISPLRRPTAKAGAIHSRLKEQLRDFDRDPQIGGFRSILGEEWDRARKPIICTIAGLGPDRPEWCRDKCRRLGLDPRFQRLKIRAERVDMIHIAWPDSDRFEHERELAELLNSVKAHLDPRRDDPEAFRLAYNSRLSPVVFYSNLEERMLHQEPHRRLLRAWIDFWSRVGDKPLKKPFVHFLLLTLDEHPEHSGRAGPDYGAYRAFYEQLLSEAGVEHQRCLPLLRHFRRDEIETWIGNLEDDLRLGRSQLGRLRDQVDLLFRHNPAPRLADMEAWVDEISL